MISALGELLLNDWDHAGLTERKAGETHKSFRTVSLKFLEWVRLSDLVAGHTWPFMSIALLENARKAHDIFDDYESIFWAQLYGAVKCFAGGVSFDMQIFFQQSRKEGAGVRHRSGGTMKRGILQVPLVDVELDCGPFQALLKDLANRWYAYYHAARETESEFKDKRELYRPSSFWVEILDRHMRNVEE